MLPGRKLLTAAVLLAPLTLALASPARAETSLTELKEMSLDQLLALEVTSVSKRPELLAEAPTSIYVITAEAIRRSGVITLPEALRLAPNLQVARIDTAQYAISARGFNNAIGNKLLVLVDGRTVYTPLFSGVFWDQQDVMLEDVERIEVISGPGATLWGANAVNGVINVITRPAAETKGFLLGANVGDEERGAHLRYGAEFTDAAFRVYARYAEFDRMQYESGVDAPNEWQRAQIGFRADWRNGADRFTLQGDAYEGESEHRGFVGPFEFPPIEVRGANLLGRWQREMASGSELQLQVYVDHTDRTDALFYGPKADILDIDLQYAIAGDQHHVLWGAGYRHGRDEIRPGFVTVFVPDSRSLDWGNLFIQDEIQLTERVGATVGLKLESNDYTGVEVLPTLRLDFQPTQDFLIWGAASRAVRAPARYDTDVRFPGFPPYLVIGGPDFRSEVANVIELGLRSQPVETFSYSVTTFVHLWDRLRSGTAIPVELENKIEGEIWGIEAWADWRATDFWVLSVGGTWMEEDLELESDSTDPVGVDNETLRNDADYQWMARSRVDLPANFEFDLLLRHVAKLPAPSLAAYTELDARFAWRPSEKLEIAVVGRNLLDDRHSEFGAAASRSTVPRHVFGQVRWQF
jgi:iron complex outermembrane recepter protein